MPTGSGGSVVLSAFTRPGSWRPPGRNPGRASGRLALAATSGCDVVAADALPEPYLARWWPPSERSVSPTFFISARSSLGSEKMMSSSAVTTSSTAP